MTSLFQIRQRQPDQFAQTAENLQKLRNDRQVEGLEIYLKRL